MKNELRKSIGNLIQKFEVFLSEQVQQKWVEFAELTLEWNQKTNLISAKSLESVCEILFVDALATLKLKALSSNKLEGMSWIDIGAGGGAPTIPIALAWPNFQYELVEPRTKREMFLNLVVQKFNGQNQIKVVKKKVNAQKPSLENMPFDVASSRATFPPNEWIEVGSKLAHLTLVYTRPQIEIELPKNTKIVEQRHYELPSKQSEREIILIEKTSI